MSDTINILLVEDNKDFAKLVQVYLHRFEAGRFAVTWKENHAEAMAFLRETPKVDIVLMDYFLPGKPGWKSRGKSPPSTNTSRSSFSPSTGISASPWR